MIGAQNAQVPSDPGRPEQGGGEPSRRLRLEEGTVVAAAVVRVGREIRPPARPGEGWPRERLGVAVQRVCLAAGSGPARRRGAA